MSEVAGRLEIPVESDTTGFAQKLKRKVEAAAREVVATIRAEVDASSVKEVLEAKVKEAQNGVAAHIGIELEKDSEAKLRAKLETVVKGAAAGIKAKVGVEVDKKTAQEMRKAIDGSRGKGVEVPAKIDRKGLFASWVAARRSIERDAKKKTLDIPLMPSSFRSAFMPILYGGIASLIEPLISVIGGAIGGLAAMAGNLASVTQLAAAAPAAFGAMILTTKTLGMSFKFLGEDIKKVPKELLPIRREFDKVKKSWTAMSTGVASTFWKDLKDQIRPVSDAVLPVLDKALNRTAKTLAGVGLQAAAMVKTPLFKKQFGGLLGDSNKIVGALGQAFLGLVKGMLNVSAAAGPLVDRISGFIKRAGEWASGIAAPGEKAKHFGEELKYAGDKAAQLWRMMKDAGAAIKSTFLAGRESGDRLLESLEKNVKKWRDWAGSAKGQNTIKQWFKDVEPIAREVGSLIVDVGKSLARMSQDPNVGGLVKTLREKLLPSLERFLTNLGRTLGPSVIALVGSLLEILTEFSEAGSPVGRALGLVADGLGKIADVLRANPRLAQTIGVILGGLTAYRALAFLGKMTGVLGFFDGLSRKLGGGGLAVSTMGFSLALAGLTGSLSGLPGPANGAAAALGTFMLLQPMVTPMSTALSNLMAAVKTSGGGFGGFARAIGTKAGGGITGALRGLGAALGIGAAGGPAGAAIAVGLGVVATAVGAWAQAHADAKEKAQAYKGLVDEIVASLDAESGALSKASEGVVANNLIHTGAAAKAKAYGVDLRELTRAAMGNADAQKLVNVALRNSITSAVQAHPRFRDLSTQLKTNGISQAQFNEALLEGGGAFAAMKGKVLEGTSGNHVLNESLIDLLKSAYDSTQGQRDLANSIGTTSQATKDAIARSKLYNELTGKTAEQVDNVRDKLAKTKSKSVKVTALTKESVTALEKLGYKVTYNTKNKTFTITATAKTAAAERAIANAARNREASINVTYRARNRPPSTYGGNYGGGQADGSVLRFAKFAEGGFHSLADMARNRFKSFANGVERHVAQIARPGDWRVWAEPETGGEAYIPLAGSKRARSTAILREVADQFGYALAPKMNSLARGLSAVHAASAVNAPTPSAGFDRQAAERLVIQMAAGAVQVTNPAPEPAGKSVQDSLRNITEFGLGG